MKKKKENDNDIIEQQNIEDIGLASEDFEKDVEKNLENDILMLKIKKIKFKRLYETNCTENNKGLFLDVNINEKKICCEKIFTFLTVSK